MATNALPEYFLKSIKLPTFNGNDRHYRADEWLEKFDEYFEDANTAEGHKLRIIRQHLKDTAHRWFHKQGFNIDGDYPEFKKKFEKRFGKPDDSDSALKRLITLKQTRSVEKYVSAFEALRSRIDDMSDYMATQLFINGLKTEISKLIHANSGLDNDDFDAVVALAEKIDAAPNHERDFIRPNHSHQYRRQDETYPQPMELDAIRTHPGTQSRFQRAPTREATKQKDFADDLCFYCHKPGHRINECPERNKKALKSKAHSLPLEN